jgi:TonB family protein
MSSRDVRDRMGERGDVQTDKRRARFHRGDSTLWVEFDDEIGKRSARVVVIRSHTRTRGDDSVILGSLRERLGEPTTGGKSLADGLRAGPAVWNGAECGVVIEATREEPDWWDPSKGGIVVEAREIPRVTGSAEVIAERDAGAALTMTEPSTAPSAPPPPATNLRRDEPGPEVTRTGANPVSSGDSPSGPIAVAGVEGVTFPERLAEHYVRPVYPRAARRAKVGGTVYLDVIVRDDGTVGEITVVDSTRTGIGFEEAAIAAVKRWRYRPAMRGRQPVDASVLVRIDFQ